MSLGAATVLERNAVQVTGSGATVVLAHGFGCDQGMWDAVLPHLTGYRVVRYDLTGMGASDYSAYDERRYATLAGHARDLIDIIEGAGGAPVIAIGHSVSAMTVALAAIERPDLFRALVMICGSPCYLEDGDYHGGFQRADLEGLLKTIEQNFLGWAGQLAGMVGGPDAPEAVASLEDRFCANDPIISRHFAEVTFLGDYRDVLPDIPVPCLLIQAEDDNIAPAAVGTFMDAVIPDSRLVTLPYRGHAPHMSIPGPTAEAIEAFLEETTS